MYIYNFTNDLRPERAMEYLNSVSKYLETGKWENNDLSFDKAKKGMFHAFEQYYGLKKGLSNTNLVMQGKELLVIKEFVKKFQYPNPRNTKEKTMFDIIDNGQSIVPLRIAVKLLYKRLTDNNSTTATITNDEFRKYILTNPTIAEGSEDISALDSFIKENPEPKYNTDFMLVGGGGDKERFIRTLFGIANLLPFMHFAAGVLRLDISNLTDQDKYMLGDILLSKDRWDYPEDIEDYSISDLQELYKDYMQVIPEFNSVNKINIELGISNSNEPNIIYYGAPGTGKSFEVNEIIKEEYSEYDETLNSEGSEFVFRTTIHNDYSYYDFVGQIMPFTDQTDKNKIKYDFNSGIFTNALIKAYLNPKKEVFLILEEMSRGNITSIFGDIFQLLDRDINTGISEYGITNKLIAKEIFVQAVTNRSDITEIEKETMLMNISEDTVNNFFIKLPGNLNILGTLNTSDQSVSPMDSAFRRRFSFKYISLNPIRDTDTGKYLNNFIFKNEGKRLEWINFYQGLNKFIQENTELAEDKFVGQFFIKGKVAADGVAETEEIIEYNSSQIRDKLLSYLFNDVESHIRISNTEVSIFKNKNISYSEIYTSFKKQENVFSDELLKRIDTHENENGSD